MGECRLSGACAEEPRPKSLTTRSSPDQRRRPHPSTGCGFLVRKPQYEQFDVLGRGRAPPARSNRTGRKIGYSGRSDTAVIIPDHRRGLTTRWSTTCVGFMNPAGPGRTRAAPGSVEVVHERRVRDGLQFLEAQVLAKNLQD